MNVIDNETFYIESNALQKVKIKQVKFWYEIVYFSVT